MMSSETEGRRNRKTEMSTCGTYVLPTSYKVLYSKEEGRECNHYNNCNFSHEELK
jgi:hypothetical protein